MSSCAAALFNMSIVLQAASFLDFSDREPRQIQASNVRVTILHARAVHHIVEVIFRIGSRRLSFTCSSSMTQDSHPPEECTSRLHFLTHRFEALITRRRCGFIYSASTLVSHPESPNIKAPDPDAVTREREVAYRTTFDGCFGRLARCDAEVGWPGLKKPERGLESFVRGEITNVAG